jgi:outer membrane protein OmpA-like peptidoglycan-associated protein
LESGSSRLIIYAAYLADEDIGPLGEETIRKILQERSGSIQLALELERVSHLIPISFRARSDTPTAESRESLKKVAAQIRRFPRIRSSIVVPSDGRQDMSALNRRRAEQISEFLSKEAGIPADTISVATANETGGQFALQLLPGKGP